MYVKVLDWNFGLRPKSWGRLHDSPLNSSNSWNALHEINKSVKLFYSAPKSYQRAGQLCLLHLGITKTAKIELKRKTDEQISPVNGVEPWDQSNWQKTKVEDKIFWKGRFWA